MAEKTIGQRVGELRREQGIRRADLAAAVGRSVDWLVSIEVGRRNLNNFGIIQQLADHLRVDISELTDRPARSTGIEGKRGFDAIPAIRRALLRAQLPGPVGGTPVALEHLRRSVDKAHHHRRHGEFGDLGLILPHLLTEAAATAGALEGDASAEALVLLAEARHDAAMMTKKLGHVDLAALAATQSLQAATASGDELWMAAAAWTQAEVYFSAGAVPEGLTLVQNTLDRLDGLLGSDDPRVWSLWGTLHLLAALGAAQWNERADVAGHLAEAERALAANEYAERDDFQTVFGPANTALIRVGAALELGDGPASLDSMRGVSTRQLPKERKARHLIDVGRANMAGGRDEQAMTALLDASRMAPEYTHAHALVRDMVVTALNREKASSRAPARVMAHRIGVD